MIETLIHNIVIHSSPDREDVKIKHGDSVGVDADDEDGEADQVHHHARLHHVNRPHAAVTKHYSVGSRGHREREGVGAGDGCWESQVDGIDTHGDGHVSEDGDQSVGSRGVVAEVGDDDGETSEEDAGGPARQNGEVEFV